MSEQDMLKKFNNFYKKLFRLSREIESHQKNNETEQAEVKIKQLDKLILRVLRTSEQPHSIFSHVIAQSGYAVNMYILKTMATRMSKSKLFDEIEKTVNKAAYNLTQEPHHLKRKVAVNAVKFGIQIAVFKKANNQECVKYANRLFKTYLKCYCRLDHVKVDEIISAIEPLALKLLNSIASGKEGLLYTKKIYVELYSLQNILPGESFFSFEHMYEDYENSFGPLIKQIRLICDHKLKEEENQLKSALEEFNISLVFDYGASSEEIGKIADAFSKHKDIFELELLSFMSRRASSVTAGSSVSK